MGPDGNLDTDQLLAERGFDPLLPLQYILLAIIDAHPVKPPHRKSDKSPNQIACTPKSAPTRQARLEKALAALVGTGRRKRGMDEKDDYELLIQMGWKYHCLFFSGDGKKPEIDPIARECLEQSSREGPGLHTEVSPSEIARLRRKFTTDRDLYIARAVEQRNYHRMDKLRELASIVEHLKNLGIPTDPDALRPLIVETEA